MLYGIFIDEELVYVDTIENSEEAFKEKWERYIKDVERLYENNEWLQHRSELRMQTIYVPDNIDEETAKEVLISAFNPLGQFSAERHERIQQGWIGMLHFEQ